MYRWMGSRTERQGSGVVLLCCVLRSRWLLGKGFQVRGQVGQVGTWAGTRNGRWASFVRGRLACGQAGRWKGTRAAGEETEGPADVIVSPGVGRGRQTNGKLLGGRVEVH